ncbi:hypothetical protein SAMN06265173_1732 [Thalassovita litoralis]|jgi:hypothetical protein|uniref:Uncharacterized protein n=1 Tax=Thalassovita litoralis TaxID=1010611 RepID=A0A521FW60_9RHOB|nr:hypothetical protein [Thalassovita litoralis]SMP00131.1 hypothetical protein SAMN06265173_1732 [Thalassovita litoralis]
MKLVSAFEQQPQGVLYGLVRRADGSPRIDDVAKLHPGQISLLSAAERAALGIWQGPLAIDAQGIKRLTRISATEFEATDALVAASEIWDGSARWRLTERTDCPAGETLTLEI